MADALDPPILDESHSAFVQGPVTIGIGSRNAANLPSLTRSIGCRVSEDRRRVTVFVMAGRAAALLRDLRAGGPIAAVFTRPSTHETIQLKGAGVTVAPLSEGDMLVVQAAREAITTELGCIGHNSRFVAAALFADPGQMAAVTFTPGAAFMQTPGPGAGRPLGA
jgi:hypothetical protein